MALPEATFIYSYLACVSPPQPPSVQTAAELRCIQQDAAGCFKRPHSDAAATVSSTNILNISPRICDLMSVGGKGGDKREGEGRKSVLRGEDLLDLHKTPLRECWPNFRAYKFCRFWFYCYCCSCRFCGW